METKLHTAVRYGNDENVLQALKEGLDPNQIGDYKWSPVHEAAHNGERDILKLLILFNGNVNQVDGLHGNTPLHYAAQEDNSACVTVLLTAGATVDVKNEDGLTPTDVATSSCKERMDIFFNSQNSTSPGEWKDGQLVASPNGANKSEGKDGQNQNDEWDGVVDIPPNAAIGHIHLSFEYHKTNLKVRVWQVADLLLPPPQTSMIESIFVRSYLIPDLVKKTNRKTEDVRVDGSSSKEISQSAPAQHKDGIQHIFTPSSFRFESPLLYQGVTQDIVAERSMQIEVCMTQKHTHKPFLIAMVHMPLKTAVRRPIRQRYPLIPCMNYTIPNNMRVYSAREIFVEGSYTTSYSRSNSSHSNGDSNLSEIHLESVASEIPEKKFVSVDISDDSDTNEDKEDNDDDDDDDIDDGIGSSVDVKICSGKESVSSSVTVDMTESGVDEDEMLGQLTQVVSHKMTNASQDTSVVEMTDNNNVPEVRPKKKIIPNETFPKSSDVEATHPKVELVPVRSSVVDIEDAPKTTVVDINHLQRDVVLDLESHHTEELRESKNGEKHYGEQDSTPTTTTGVQKKKKIIPFESGKSLYNLNDRKKSPAKNRNGNKISNQGKMNPPTISVTNISRPRGNEDGEMEDDDVAEELESSHFQDVSFELSPSSQELGGSSPTASSRPETPIWDFYDFCDEDTAEGDVKKDEPNVDDPQVSSGPDSIKKSEGVKTMSTLQESLARLSRPQTTLDTCRVAGPVLPSVVIDDFEMDED